jgi:predicted exporter
VGSNYALFFDTLASAGETDLVPSSLASLLIANLCTVIGFGLMSFSQVPVLEALGLTVAPGAFLSLLFAAALIPPSGRAPRAARAPRPGGAPSGA